MAILQFVFEEISRVNQPVVLLAFGMVGWAVWRFIRFTAIPWFYPDDPKELPYLIPFLGHTWAFWNSAQRTLTNGRIYFGDDRQPFAVTAWGTTFYVLTSLRDVSEAYGNDTSLSFNIFVKEMLRTIGMSSSGLKAMYQPPSVHKEGFPNPKEKPLAVLSRELHQHQLLPGKNLDQLRTVVCEVLDENIMWSAMTNNSRFDYVQKEDGSVVVPLMTICSHLMVLAEMRGYFGEQLERLEPSLLWTFIEFDDLSWQVLYQYPRALSKKMHVARDKVIEILERYFSIAQEERLGDAWFPKAMEDEMHSLGMNSHEVALVLMTVLWGATTNTRKSAFWMMAFLLFDKKLMQSLTDETSSVFYGPSRIPDVDALANCTTLNAVWNETVRISSFSASVRYVLRDTRLGGKVLRQGNRLMIPYRQLHLNEDVFGPNVKEFNHKRFLENPGLSESSGFRPFGAGQTYCPGRFIAKQSVTTLVVMLLDRFDIELVGSPKFPRAEENHPVLGVMNLAAGDDVQIRLRPRSIR